MSGVVIWNRELEGIAQGASPAMLRDAADVWAVDLERFGPWSSVSAQPNNGAFRGWLSQVDVVHSCLIVGPCTSSLDFTWQLAGQGSLSSWDSALTVSQSAGRGQLGRSWYSPPGNIYGAWCIPAPNGPLKNMLSLLLGYVVTRCLSDLGVSAQLKWPNDIMMDNKKVGGILVEEKNGTVIAGIGINLTSSPQNASPKDAAPKEDVTGKQYPIPAGYLREMGYDFTPLKLWLHLVTRGKTYFNDIVSGGSRRRLISALGGSLAFMGESVMVTNGHTQPFRGCVVGLADDGQLKLSVEGKERTVHSGSIYPIR